MRTAEHLYGPHIHILDDPYLNSLLTSLCVPSTGQPLFNDLIRQVYQGLAKHFVTTTYPTKRANVKTRMATEYPQAVLNSEVSRKSRARPMSAGWPIRLSGLLSRGIIQETRTRAGQQG